MKKKTNIIILGIIAIFFTLGLANDERTKSPLNDIVSQNNESITKEEIFPIPNQSQEIFNISGTALTCTDNNGVNIVDLRLVNIDSITTSVKIYPLNRSVTMIPQQIMRIDLFLPKWVEKLTVISDKGERMEIQLPRCFERGGSSGNSPAGIQEIRPTSSPTPEPTQIPEFPTIFLPVIATLVLLFSLQKNKL